MILTKLLVFLLDGVGLSKHKGKRASEHLRTGKRGEDAAYFYLREHGYVIVARNWRSRRRKGEIDLVGWDGDTLCFIEVKTRSTRDVKPAEAAVDHDKQRELRAMAREYLWRAARSRRLRATSATKDAGTSSQTHSGTGHRFDVVSVYYDSERRIITDITLFCNAFSVA